MYAVIGGINLDPDQPGYKHIIMSPHPGGGLTYATTELDSMYGKIQSAWTLENGRFHWQVTVPANTTATIHIPAKAASFVKESDRPLESTDGVTFLHAKNDILVLHIVSGTYHFSSNLE